MAKPFRSPLVGYNHNLSHLGRVFHVQSEDSGPAMPRVFTHLFFGGTILVSRKHEYDGSLPDDKVRVLMRDQHKALIKDLMQGRFDERIIAFFAARGEDVAPAPAKGADSVAAQNTIEGAVPSAPLMATPGPVVVVPETSRVFEETEMSPAEAALAAGVDDILAREIQHVEQDARNDQAATAAAGRPDGTAAARPDAGQNPRWPDAVSPPPAGHRRRVTRPIEALNRKASAQGQLRFPDGSTRPVVAGDEPTAVVSVASADGVVVHRSVVVGGKPGSERAPRIRPPVPYVVTGGGHSERPPQAAAAKATPGPASVSAAASARAPQSGAAPAAGGEAPRPAAGFGVGRTDDKSLDEVILEYLGEDTGSDSS
jgi:hypothetical protein